MEWLIWAVLAAFFAGLTAVLAKAGVAGVDSNLATAIRTAVVLVLSWGIVLCTVPLQRLAELERKTWVFLVLSGIATGLSWLCYFRALQLGEVSRVAPIDKLGMVFAVIFAVLFLRERLSGLQTAGVAFIVIGAIALSWSGGK